MKGVPAGGSHAPQQWQTVINTNLVTRSAHCRKHQFFLTLSRSMPRVLAPLHSADDRNQPTRAMNQTESELELIELDIQECVCAWSCCWKDPGWQVKVWWGGSSFFSAHIFLISCRQISFLNPVNPHSLTAPVWEVKLCWSLAESSQQEFISELHRLYDPVSQTEQFWSTVHTK